MSSPFTRVTGDHHHGRPTTSSLVTNAPRSITLVSSVPSARNRRFALIYTGQWTTVSPSRRAHRLAAPAPLPAHTPYRQFALALGHKCPVPFLQLKDDRTGHRLIHIGGQDESHALRCARRGHAGRRAVSTVSSGSCWHTLGFQKTTVSAGSC